MHGTLTALELSLFTVTRGGLMGDFDYIQTVFNSFFLRGRQTHVNGLSTPLSCSSIDRVGLWSVPGITI